MEKAVTALFNQLLLLFSIMQGINAEPLTGKLLGVGADAYGYWQDVCDGFGGEVVSLFPIFLNAIKEKE